MPKRKRAPVERVCDRCGVTFTRTSYIRVKYCSVACRVAVVNDKLQALNPKLERSKATVGAVSELVVTVDLLRRGYDVFRAVSPSCSCDLIAVARGAVTRVEVRTGYWTLSKELRCNHKPDEETRYDVLAIVAPNGSIEYRTSHEVHAVGSHVRLEVAQCLQ